MANLSWGKPNIRLVYLAGGGILTIGTIVAGTLYTAGTYKNVQLTGGTGTGAKATIVVTGGGVTAVTITFPGKGYTAGNSLAAAATSIGGTGSGFTVAVGTISTAGVIPTSPIYITIPNIVQGSTQLTSTKGTRREAPLEGGDFADLSYNKNAYVLEFEMYATKGLEKPVPDVEGIISDEYAIFLKPEDPLVEGIKIERSKLSVDDTFSADIGKKWKYTADVLPPADGTNSVKFLVIA